MTPVTPSMASGLVADVDKSCQALRGLLAVQPDVLVKLPAREIQQAGATVLALVDELNAWFLEHMAVVPRAKNKAANDAQHDGDSFDAALIELRAMAASIAADSVTARIRGINFVLSADDGQELAKQLADVADVMASYAGEPT